MDILKAIYSSSDYLPALQVQALGTANAHVVLRNSPGFCCREEGKSQHNQGCYPLLPMG